MDHRCARPVLGAALGGALFLAMAGEAPARLREDGAPAHALGMADAVRATATGSSGLFYNPAGIRLVRSYSFEGSYGFSGDRPGHAWSISGVDSRTNPQLALGVQGTWIDSEEGGLDRSGKRFRGGLASGAQWDGGSLQLGVGVHYLDLTKALSQDAGEAAAEQVEFLTMDAGMVLDLGGVLRIAAVAQNLVDTKSIEEAPRTVGFGATAAFSRFELSFDTELDLETVPGEPTPSYAAGTQVLLGGAAVARAGYSTDGITGAKRIAGGLGYVSREMAADVGVSKRIEGPEDWLVSFGLRYFLP